MPLENIGKMLVLFGGFLLALGLFFILGGRFLHLGRLPGDILIKRGNFTFYFPIVTCVALSVILSLISILFTRR